MGCASNVVCVVICYGFANCGFMCGWDVVMLLVCDVDLLRCFFCSVMCSCVCVCCVFCVL